MNKTLTRPQRFFFGTRTLPCPYLPEKVERKVVTDLAGADPQELYERLSRAGFRRSHGLAYRPACPGCSACVPVRIRAEEFVPGKSFRRILRNNADLTAEDRPAAATAEQYRLFLRYQRSRHSGGDMSEMSFSDYRAMVEDTPVESRIIEFRDSAGTLKAAMLADRTDASLSAVYSFFEPAEASRGYGSFMILWLVEHAKNTSRPHVYLGYWIEDSPKMAYKVRFRPLETLGPEGWVTLTQ